MRIDDLIGTGWSDHAERTAEVGERLEAGLALVENAANAAGYMNLVNHCIGDHLGDRERAQRLCEAAITRLEGEVGPAPLLCLAVSRHLAGDVAGAEQAERQAGEDPAFPVRVGLLVAQGRMHAGDWKGATALYTRMLARAEALEAGHGAERAAAVVSNNLASELLDVDPRSPTQAALMVRAAEAAHTFWKRVGTWVNDERGEVLKALVYTALGRPDEGRACAERGLQTLRTRRAEPQEERVDEAFLLLAHAGACGVGDDRGMQRASLTEAETIAATFEDAGLKEWFAKERAKVC